MAAPTMPSAILKRQKRFLCREASLFFGFSSFHYASALSIVPFHIPSSSATAPSRRIFLIKVKLKSVLAPCILRGGCPLGGLRSGAVSRNAGESTRTWTRTQKCQTKSSPHPTPGRSSPRWTHGANAVTQNAGSGSARGASSIPISSTAARRPATAPAIASASGNTRTPTYMKRSRGRTGDSRSPARRRPSSTAGSSGYWPAFSPWSSGLMARRRWRRPWRGAWRPDAVSAGARMAYPSSQGSCRQAVRRKADSGSCGRLTAALTAAGNPVFPLYI